MSPIVPGDSYPNHPIENPLFQGVQSDCEEKIEEALQKPTQSALKSDGIWKKTMLGVIGLPLGIALLTLSIPIEVLSRGIKHLPGKNRLAFSEWILSKAILPAGFLKSDLKTAETDPYLRNKVESLKYFPVETEDEVKLNALLLSPKNAREPPEVVIQFNMNKAKMDTNHQVAASYLEQGLHVVKFDYRGVGKSEGRLKSAEDLIKDGRAVVAKVLSDKIVEDKKRVILHGHSIGGSVATALGAENPRMKLVASRTFTRWTDAAYDVVSAYTRSTTLGSLARKVLKKTSRSNLDTVESLNRRLSAEHAITLIEFAKVDKILKTSKLTGKEVAFSENLHIQELSDAGHTDILTITKSERGTYHFSSILQLESKDDDGKELNV